MKNTLIIIGCSFIKHKANNIQAKNLYNKSRLFNLSYKLAKEKTNNILILSSKYGLIKPEDNISYYNKYIKDYDKQDKINWGIKAIKKLNNYISINKIKIIIFYCGMPYYKYLIKGVPKQIKVLTPFHGTKGAGQIEQFLENKIAAIYRKKSIRLT